MLKYFEKLASATDSSPRESTVDGAWS